MEAPGLPLAVAGGRAPSASVDPGRLLRIQFELASTDQGPLCARPGAGPCPRCEWHTGPALQMPPVWESLPLIPFRVCPEAAVPASCPGVAFAGFAGESRALAAGVGGPYGVNADPPTPVSWARWLPEPGRGILHFSGGADKARRPPEDAVGGGRPDVGFSAAGATPMPRWPTRPDLSHHPRPQLRPWVPPFQHLAPAQPWAL